MLLQMALSLLDGINKLSGPDDELIASLLKILADAHSALSLSDLFPVFVDSLRSKLKLLKSQKT